MGKCLNCHLTDTGRCYYNTRTAKKQLKTTLDIEEDESNVIGTHQKIRCCQDMFLLSALRLVNCGSTLLVPSSSHSASPVGEIAFPKKGDVSSQALTEMHIPHKRHRVGLFHCLIVTFKSAWFLKLL